MACAALHDVGKPYEYNRTERPKWVADDKEYGMPNLRHPSYGVFICGVCELPAPVLNVAGYHSPEGRFIKRSAYGEIVHYADDGSWFSLARLCDLNIPKL